MDLEREARVIARYLLGVEIGAALARRYAEAVERRLGDARPDVVHRAAIARPALLPFIDSALALSEPDDPLRQRILVMAAILEATPEHADRFLKEPPGAIGLVRTLAGAGLRAAVRAPVGLGLVAILRRLG